MTPLVEVTATLDANGVGYALIGAGAMSVHGVTRSTLDIDLLTTEARCLTPSLWDRLVQIGVDVEVRRGDPDDPLAGVVCFSQRDTRPTDLVVGRHRWQQRAVERARPAAIGKQTLPVVTKSDLVLLKLYAGGAQDMWDLHQLLADTDRTDLISSVEVDLGDLPKRSVERWRQILKELRDP